MIETTFKTDMFSRTSIINWGAHMREGAIIRANMVAGCSKQYDISSGKLTQCLTQSSGVLLYPAYMAGLFNIPWAAIAPVNTCKHK